MSINNHKNIEIYSNYIMAHNNSRNGCKSYGGDLYTRCKLHFELVDSKLTLNGKYYTAQGEEDIQMETINFQKYVNPHELEKLKKYGFEYWCEDYFGIKRVLDNKQDLPFY